MKKTVFLTVFLLFFNFGFSQSDVVKYMNAGTADASKLFKAYLNPFANALGDGLNNSWYYTAGTHKRLGFDFSMSISVTRVPESDRSFDLGQLMLENIRVDNSQGTFGPTVVGADTLGPTLYIMNPTNSSDTLSSFSSPSGTNMNLIPVPMAQFAIGLFPHTDISLRYVPKLSFNSESQNRDKMRVGMFGVGIKHSFNDWMPVLKRLPFDASVFATYSNINANSGIDFRPVVNDPAYVPDENQQLEVNTNTSKIGLIVSKKIAFVTLFGGIGNSRSDTKIDLLGRFPVISDSVDGQFVWKDETDPIKLRFNYSRVSMDAGIRLKFSFFNVFASVNKAEYSSFNLGASIGVR